MIEGRKFFMAVIEVCDVCKNKLLSDHDGITIKVSDMDGYKPATGWYERNYNIKICNSCKNNIIKYCKKKKSSIICKFLEQFSSNFQEEK